LEVSAKNRQNIDEIFFRIVRDIRRLHGLSSEQQKSDSPQTVVTNKKKLTLRAQLKKCKML
jgi:hypothetical protein